MDASPTGSRAKKAAMLVEEVAPGGGPAARRLPDWLHRLLPWGAFAILLLQVRRDRPVQVLLGLALAVNVILILGVVRLANVFGIHGLDHLADEFHLSRDNSFAEIFNYAQAVATAGLMLAAAVRLREACFAAWALIFGFVAADDSLQLHERVGTSGWARDALPTLPNLRHRDTGELFFWILGGCVLVGLLVLAHRGAPKITREVSMTIAGTFALLVGFAVGLDMITIVFASDSAIYNFLNIVEDGGEMLAIWLSFAVALLLYRATAKNRSLKA